MSRRTSLSTKVGRTTATTLMALILVYVLFGNSLLEARVGISARGGAPPEEKTNQPTLQERMLQVPNGSMIEVRLLNKQKLRGRLGEITSEGFSLQTAQGSQIEAQKVAFTDVKSFKQTGKTGKKVGTGVLIGLAAFGTLAIIGIAILASGGYGG